MILLLFQNHFESFIFNGTAEKFLKNLTENSKFETEPELKSQNSDFCNGNLLLIKNSLDTNSKLSKNYKKMCIYIRFQSYL